MGTNLNIYVKEWNGNSWVTLGGAVDRVVSRNAQNVVLAIFL
jgi:hypothetical protein